MPNKADPFGGNRLVLVAEDNEVNQKVLFKQLALLGFRAEMAGNGAEALACWRRGGHALLLTDLHMPQMDGFTLVATVRAEERSGAHMPIAALTANALRDEAVRCRKAGMDGYLSKPVRLSQLKAAVAPCLRPTPAQLREVEAGHANQKLAPPADLGVLAELVGDDPQVMREVLKVFHDSTLRAGQDMAHLHVTGAHQAVADVAHKWKSGARSIGAMRLGQICADIEDAATDTLRAAVLSTLLSNFEAEMRAVDQFLDLR